jgi:hypothetical protein
MPGILGRAAMFSVARAGTHAALVLGVISAACSGQARGIPSADRAAPEDAGASSFQATDGGTSSVTASIAPPAPTVCAGQCVDLTLVASGGVGPYTIRWSDGVVSGRGPRQVCPTTTTTYAATVTDASGSGGEIPHPGSQASASVTVTVSSSGGACAEGGTPDASSGGPSTVLPATGLHTLCKAQWQTKSGISTAAEIRRGPAAVAVDATGDIVAATDFYATFGAAAGAPTSQGSSDAIVMKLDAQCNVVWTRQFGAPDALLSVIAVATDASSNVVLVGSFQTDDTPNAAYWVDLGAGRQAAAHPGAFVMKLDPSGKTLWVKTYVPAELDGSGTSFVQDLAIDPEGNAVFVVNGDVSIGSAVVDAGSRSSDVVKLDPSGNLVFAKPSDALAPSAWTIQSVDTASDGSIWVAGTDPNSGTLRAVHLAANAAVLSTTLMPSPIQVGLWSGGAVRVGSSGDVVLSASSGPGQPSADWNRWFEELAPAGQMLWSHPATDFSGTPEDPAELVRVDSSGNAWVAGELASTLDVGAPVGVLTSPSPNGSMFVSVFGPDGRPRSGTAIAGATEPYVEDMALGANATVVLTGWDSTTTTTTFFFVSKLGF